MPASAGPRRVLSAAALTAALLAVSSGCAENPGDRPAASPPASVPASASPSAPVPVPPSPSLSPSPSPTPAPATTRATTPPPAPTRLTVAAQTRGGRLALVRGGAAQEFTVSLRNGNTVEYRHLLITFQMESLVGEPGDQPGSGPGFLLERLDASSGAWRPAELRIANDAKPPSLFTGGSPLARDAVRVERYRIRATPGGPTGSSPVVVSFIDTDADREAAPHVILGHSTR